MGGGKSRPQGGAEAPVAGSGKGTEPLDPEEAEYLKRGVVLVAKLVHEDGYVDMREGTLKASPSTRVVVFNISAEHPRYRLDALRRETERAKGFSHPAILAVHSTWEDDEGFHVVEDLPPGRVLLDEVIKLWTSFCERDAAFVASKVLDGVAYLHSKGVAHRELNVGTVFVDRDAEGGGGVRHVKLVDFALSSLREQEDAMSLRKAEYPPYHYAPEAMVEEYVELPDSDFFAADAWSVGVMVHTLLSGYPPIRDNDRRELVKRLQGGQVTWQEEVWTRFSQAKDFVGGLLTLDAAQRAVPAECLNHAWLRDASARSDEPLNVGDALGKYKARTRSRKLKTVVRGMTAASRMQRAMNQGGAAAIVAAANAAQAQNVQGQTEE